jgi:hypothetical protein
MVVKSGADAPNAVRAMCYISSGLEGEYRGCTVLNALIRWSNILSITIYMKFHQEYGFRVLHRRTNEK